MQVNLNRADQTCRCSGEEVINILPESTPVGTLKRHDQLCEGVKRLGVQKQGLRWCQVTISLGMACFLQSDKSGYAELRAVDWAVFRSETAGKDCVTMAEDRTGRYNMWRG